MRKMILLAAMAAIAALMLAAAPAFADDNHDRNDNDNHCDFFDCHDNDNHDLFDNNNLDNVFFTNDFVSDEDLADELCSPLNSDEINNLVPGCIFGNNNNVVFDDFNRHDLFDEDHHHDLFDD